MFLLVSGRHVGAHLGGHQHGVSIQISINLGKTFLRISSIRKIVIFKRAHQVENSTKYRADDLCANLVCEYFCWMLGDPHFFFGRSLPFLILCIILKNKKKSVRGKF